VTLDRALEALALRDARDLDHLAGLEDVHAHLVADLELARVVANSARVPRAGRRPS
jgi:hypothetical protein